jgi:hypothetical protein
MQVKAGRIVEDLFVPTADAEILPAKSGAQPSARPGTHRWLHRRMTDRYAMQEHGKLFDRRSS